MSAAVERGSLYALLVLSAVPVVGGFVRLAAELVWVVMRASRAPSAAPQQPISLLENGNWAFVLGGIALSVGFGVPMFFAFRYLFRQIRVIQIEFMNSLRAERGLPPLHSYREMLGIGAIDRRSMAWIALVLGASVLLAILLPNPAAAAISIGIGTLARVTIGAIAGLK